MEPTQNIIHTYNQNYQVTSVDELPVPQSQRTCTDLFCTIITTLLVIAMLVTSIAMLNVQKLQQITYPTDSDGKKCTLDHTNFNYLYFTSLTDATKRLCVSQCPNGEQERLSCWPTSKLACGANDNPQFQVQIYSSVPQQTSIGLYCLPSDPEAKNKVLENANLLQRFTFVKAYRGIWISAGIAFALGILYLVVMCCAPTVMVYGAISLGGISCIIVGILLMLQHSKFLHNQGFLIILFSIIMILFGIFCLYSLIFHRRQLNLCSAYIQRGMEILTVEQGLLLLIPIFMALLVLLLVLFGFQTFAIWSNSQLMFHQEQVYLQPQGTFATVATVFNVIQLIWGLCFLKEAFNFLVSGCAVTYHFVGDSRFMFGLSNLFKFHWGSVIAGSFLLNFFYLFDVLYDVIKPPESSRECFKCFKSLCCCCDRFLGFARGQAHAFINMVGLPYCNSARWCERLNFLTDYFNGSQSIFRFFRVGAHVMLALIATLCAFFYTASDGGANAPILLLSFVINIFVVTFFVCLVTDLAETILLCELVEKFLRNQNMYEDIEEQKPNNNIYESNVHNNGYEIHPTSP